MSFASILGTVYDVLKDGATENPPEKIGTRRRTWNGGIRSGERVYKRNWTLPLAPITETQFQTLLAATLLSARGPCVGDFTNGVTKTCVVDIASASYYRPSLAFSVFRLVVLTVSEA